MPSKWTSKFELKPNTWVFVPTSDSIKIGKEIKSAIEQQWTLPDNYYHLHAGGHLRALNSHLANLFFAHLDIKDFFGSINKSRVTRCLKGLFSYETAREMASESVVVHPTDKKLILPFGFVQSPILASLCLASSALGKCLHDISQKHDVNVSVYVDDIILSSRDEKQLQEAVCAVRVAAERSKFVLNAKKEEGPSAQITAFNIELSNASLAVEPRRLANFIASYRSAVSESKRRGIFGYVNAVNTAQANQLPP